MTSTSPSTSIFEEPNGVSRRHVCMGLCSRCPHAKKVAATSRSVEAPACQQSLWSLPSHALSRD